MSDISLEKVRFKDLVYNLFNLFEDIEKTLERFLIVLNLFQTNISFLSLTNETKIKYEKHIENITNKICLLFDCNMCSIGELYLLLTDSQQILGDLIDVIEEEDEEIEIKLLSNIIDTFIGYLNEKSNVFESYSEKVNKFNNYKKELQSSSGNEELINTIIDDLIKTWEEDFKDDADRFILYSCYLLLKLKKDPNFEKEIKQKIEKIKEARKEIKKLQDNFENSLDSKEDIVSVHIDIITLILGDKYKFNTELLENKLKELEDPIEAIYSSLIDLINEDRNNPNLTILGNLINDIITKLDEIKDKINLIISTWITVVIKLINYYYTNIYNTNEPKTYIENGLEFLEKLINFLETYNHNPYLKKIKPREKESREFLSTLYLCFLNLTDEGLKNKFQNIYPYLVKYFKFQYDLKKVGELFFELKKLVELTDQDLKDNLYRLLEENNLVEFFNELVNKINISKDVLSLLINNFKNYLKNLTLSKFDYVKYRFIEDYLYGVLCLINERFIPENITKDNLKEIEFVLDILNNLLHEEELGKIFLPLHVVTMLVNIGFGLRFIDVSLEALEIQDQDIKKLKEKIKETIDIISEFENKITNVL